MSRSSRLVVLAAGALALLGAGAAPAAAHVHHSVTTLAADPNHPYGSPSWYPLHDSVAQMDCVTRTPNCPSGHEHTDDSMTLLSYDSRTQTHFHANVYAAGFGRVHIGSDSTANTCPTATHTLGNWVWIDHGAGVISRYSHLSYHLDVTDGQLVTPRTVLGTTDSSGATAGLCGGFYLNFQIEHNAPSSGIGTPYSLTTLRSCDGSRAVAYPTFLNPSWKTWDAVPYQTRIEKQTTSCLPTTGPNTPPIPANVVLAPSGAGQLKLSWAKPTSGPTVHYIAIELQYYSSSLHRYGYVDPSHPYTSITVGGTFPLSHTFSGLRRNVRHRARVWFNGGDGWSHEGYWHYATPS